MSFSLGRFQSQGTPFTGVVADGRVWSVAEILGLDEDLGVEGLLPRWDEYVAVLGERIAGDAAGSLRRWDEAELRRLQPLAPRQLLAAGMNYRTHVVDLMVDEGVMSREQALRAMDERAASGTPLVFAALPSAMCGPEDEVRLRADCESNDWELELAVVIGSLAHRVAPAEALAHVAGYTIVNDITARELVPRKDAGPVSVDWLRSKCAPTYKPTGPYVVPAAFVPDPQALTIELRLNGAVMQHDSTADMIFGVADLVSYLSREVELLPGDVLLTGSPAGNGSHHGRFLQDGDVLEGTISGLGVQRNPCVLA